MIDDIYYSRSFLTQLRVMKDTINDVNKTVAEDKLWHGRFFVSISPKRGDWEVFYDGSGAILSLYLRIYDKKTYTYVELYGSVMEFCGSCYIWRDLNRFIIQRTQISSTQDDHNWTLVPRSKVKRYSRNIYDRPIACNQFMN